MSEITTDMPFRLRGALLGCNPFASGAEQLMERVFGLHTLDELYKELPPTSGPEAFVERCLEKLDVSLAIEPAELTQIPREGGAVLVANHPFGAIEGVVLAGLLRQIRPDVRIMANYMLTRIPELREMFIAVDPFGGGTAALRNSKPLRQAVRWVRDGGLLVVFPAGEVSSLQLRSLSVSDPVWSDTVARLVRITGAPVVPAYFPGRNSNLFQVLGLLHPRLRTLLLPRELLNRRHCTMALRIGSPIGAHKLKALDTPDEVNAYLRMRVYALGERTSEKDPQKEAVDFGEPLAAAVDSSILAAEIAMLPTEQRLDGSGDLGVYIARSAEIPWLLQEMGRLRELTFREAGEGTGKPRDLDLYDAYYRHLFIWNEAKRELVGAYRLGLADDIVRQYGKQGLYTQSLFRYRTRLLHMINPAIELGRSFIRPEYQRSYAPLLLLWKGIGRFVAQNPRYRILFGPVSISNDYQKQSRQLLVQFLQVNSFLPELARLVRPRKPFRVRRRPWSREGCAALRDLDNVSELVAQFEHDNKGVPILLKQYLKLGGRLLGFNVDPQFRDALDGLIMVDLAETEPKVLARYMGKDGVAAFLAFHRHGERKAG